MVTQPQLLLLQKTMVTVEGVARSFDPKVNIWDASEKLVGDWLKKSIGPQAVLQDMADNAGRTLRMVQRLPDTLQELERGAKAVQHMGQTKAAIISRPKPPTGWRGFWVCRRSVWRWRRLSIAFCKR